MGACGEVELRKTCVVSALLFLGTSLFVYRKGYLHFLMTFCWIRVNTLSLG